MRNGIAAESVTIPVPEGEIGANLHVPDRATGLVAFATDWAEKREDLRRLSIGYFGASTGAAAALIGAAEHPDVARAVVSRGYLH